MPSKRKPIRIYWDSCVIIDCIQRDPDHFPILSGILYEAKAGRIVFVASTLVIAEVIKLNDSSEPLDKQIALIRDFFENDFFEFQNVDRAIAESAVDFSRAYKIKPADAIHVATALHRGCECLQTYDGEKRGTSDRAGKKYMLDYGGKIGRPPLKIELPGISSAPTLFDEIERSKTPNESE